METGKITASSVRISKHRDLPLFSSLVKDDLNIVLNTWDAMNHTKARKILHKNIRIYTSNWLSKSGIEILISTKAY
jgi:hypothetical protein